MWVEEINVRLFIRTHKQMILLSLLVILVLAMLALAHKSYAGKPQISLNTPASFPVDI